MISDRQHATLNNLAVILNSTPKIEKEFCQKNLQLEGFFPGTNFHLRQSTCSSMPMIMTTPAWNSDANAVNPDPVTNDDSNEVTVRQLNFLLSFFRLFFASSAFSLLLPLFHFFRVPRAGHPSDVGENSA